MRILLFDNNDSFTRNLEHLLATSIAGAEVAVIPHARLHATHIGDAALVVISPGPGRPEEYPGYRALVEADVPVLGICLGMQIINGVRGGTTGRLAGCVHGRAETIVWRGEPRDVARYHSLHITRIGQGLEVLATNRDGVVMALGSVRERLLGYQFHPESFLTHDGRRFISDALDYLGL